MNHVTFYLSLVAVFLCFIVFAAVIFVALNKAFVEDSVEEQRPEGE